MINGHILTQSKINELSSDSSSYSIFHPERLDWESKSCIFQLVTKMTSIFNRTKQEMDYFRLKKRALSVTH